MEKLKNLFVVLALCAPLTAAADVEINETNFPDANFRNYLLNRVQGRDGVLTDEELEIMNAIDVRGEEIVSLKGIEHFRALEFLYCSGNQLTTLDVSACPSLQYLDCSTNQLTDLDLSKNTALKSLSCDWNQLTALNLSGCAALSTIMCNNNQLAIIDVSDCTALENFDCRINQLTALDVSSNTALSMLCCQYNQLTTLDVSKNLNLWYLYCTCNQIKGEGMDALINSLQQNPPRASGIFIYDDVAEDESNICTKSQVAAIREKGWTPYYVYAHNGDEKGRNEWTKAYEGMDDDNPASVTLPELENGTVEIYNLAGQKVIAPQKGGIYVVNGKKVVVK